MRYKKYKYKGLEITRIPNDVDNNLDRKLYVVLDRESEVYLTTDSKEEYDCINGWFKTKKQAKQAIDKYLKSIGMDIYHD